MNKRNHFIFVAIGLMLLLMAGCTPLQPASLPDDQVIGVVENMLTAIDQGDYQQFSRDFSPAMKEGFSEEMFTSLAELLKNASGRYTTCAGAKAELSNSQGYASYRLICEYEQEKVIVTVTFLAGGDKVEGLFFDSTNLRKATQ